MKTLTRFKQTCPRGTFKNVGACISRSLALGLALGLLTPFVVHATSQVTVLSELVQTGTDGTQVYDNSTGTTETFKKISTPSVVMDNTAIIFNGELNKHAANGITASNCTGIFVCPVADPTQTVSAVMQGDDANIGGPVFAKFSSALPEGYQGIIAFVGTVTGAGVTKTNDTGIWTVDSYGDITCVAREGGATPDGYTYVSFTSVAYPDDALGPVFLAKVQDGAKTRSILYGCTNSTLGAATPLLDVTYTLHDSITGATQTIKSFEVLKLKAPIFSPKPFAQNGGNVQMVVLVTYTSRKTALIEFSYN